MHLNLLSFAKKSALAALLLTSATGYAQLDNYEIGDMGYLRTPMESANGIILTNNHYSEIYSLKDNKLTSILKAQNCGLYTNLSKDGKYLGFKSFNEFEEQAPAILDVTTGAVTVLDENSITGRAFLELAENVVKQTEIRNASFAATRIVELKK